MELVNTVLKDISLPPQYVAMTENIRANYPAIQKANRNFCKIQTQFMDRMMSIHPLTKIRSLYQILAEIEQVRMALDESYFKIRKAEVKLKQKQSKLLQEMDPFERELLEIEIEETQSGLVVARGYIEAAIRKMNAFINQYNQILGELGKTELTEEDVEKDEARYHVMKAFEQALCAARSNNMMIDEGNHIYFFQLGVSGTAAQGEISRFLNSEVDYINTFGELPPHSRTIQFLEEMGDKYASCPQDYAKYRGVTLLDKTSLHKELE